MEKKKESEAMSDYAQYALSSLRHLRLAECISLMHIQKTLHTTRVIRVRLIPR